MTQYYKQNKDKAKELIAIQIFDGWTYEEVKEYWYALGYDIFFIKAVVDPFFINTETK